MFVHGNIVLRRGWCCGMFFLNFHLRPMNLCQIRLHKRTFEISPPPLSGRFFFLSRKRKRHLCPPPLSGRVFFPRKCKRHLCLPPMSSMLLPQQGQLSAMHPKGTSSSFFRGVKLICSFTVTVYCHSITVYVYIYK